MNFNTLEFLTSNLIGFGLASGVAAAIKVLRDESAFYSLRGMYRAASGALKESSTYNVAGATVLTFDAVRIMLDYFSRFS